MKHVPTQPDVLDLYLEQETRREIESWLLRFETAGSCARAYTEKRNMLRALIRWGLKEPETRSEVGKTPGSQGARPVRRGTHRN